MKFYKNLTFDKFLKGKNKVVDESAIEDFETDNLNGKPFEPVQKGALNPGIQLRNLRKSYSKTYFGPEVCLIVYLLLGENSNLIKLSILGNKSFKRDFGRLLQRSNHRFAWAQWCWENYDDVNIDRY